MKKFRLDGVVGYDFDAAYVASQLDGADDVEVTLNSPGGDVLDGMAIYNAFLDHKGEVTFIINHAMSMASIFMLAGNKRIARRESSMIMIHRPWSGGFGNADEMRQSAEVLDKIEAQMIQIYLGAMNVSDKKLAKMLDDETYLDADEALELGLVTEVISGSRNGLHQMAFAALASTENKFDRSKFAAKVKQIESKNTDFCANLKDCDKLSEIESAIRQRFSASRTEATAIVAAVKRMQSDSVSGATDDSVAKALKSLHEFKL